MLLVNKAPMLTIHNASFQARDWHSSLQVPRLEPGLRRHTISRWAPFGKSRKIRANVKSAVLCRQQYGTIHKPEVIKVSENRRLAYAVTTRTTPENVVPVAQMSRIRAKEILRTHRNQ